MSVKVNASEAALVVENKGDPHTRCSLTLTSPLMREDPTAAPDGLAAPAGAPAAAGTVTLTVIEISTQLLRHPQ